MSEPKFCVAEIEGREVEAWAEMGIPASPQTSVEKVTSPPPRGFDRPVAFWRLYGIIVLWPDQNINWTERGLIESAARKLYGDRVR